VTVSDLFDRAAKFFSELQTDICNALAEVDGAAVFTADAWQRPGGGGGVARVLEGGALFEKAGVNWSSVDGELPAELADEMPGDGRTFRASGVSLVLHPRSPMVPTTHANFRCLTRGNALWFGGGADLTPYYLFADDAVHFHSTLAGVCDRHRPVADYGHFKAWCDEYFFLPHRNEPRGVGGIFYDRHDSGDFDRDFAFTRKVGEAFLEVYPAIVRRRMGEAWTAEEREEQLIRRGRYVEFNLLYDRGTLFGLKTGGNVESILSSMPPTVKWP